LDRGSINDLNARFVFVLSATINFQHKFLYHPRMSPVDEKMLSVIYLFHFILPPPLCRFLSVAKEKI